jgi:hypothetical protein
MAPHFYAALLLFAASASNDTVAPPAAAPLPTSGSTNYTAYFACRQLISIDMGEIGSQSAAECAGISKNSADPGVFDNLSVRCIEEGEFRGPNAKFNGWCAQTDGDGDMFFTNYSGADDGPVTYIGGTGKYKNVLITGAWAVHDAPALPAGQFAFRLEYKVSWRER